MRIASRTLRGRQRREGANVASAMNREMGDGTGVGSLLIRD